MCDRLGIDHPIVQAPMAGGWTTPALVAAVSEAGGLGTLAGARVTAARLRAQIAETRALTARPFGINFQLAPSMPPERDDPRAREVLDGIRQRLGVAPTTPAPAEYVQVEEALAIALEAGVPIISLAMGSPAPWVNRIHAAGATLIAAATTAADAETLTAAGADVIVAQGAEAGGHRSLLSADVPDPVPLVGTMVLVPAIVDAVKVPVLAAGGIMDGRGLAAALALGAAGAQVGTRFLLATESGAPPSYRSRILAARETDTTVTDRYSGRPARGLLSAFLDAFAEAGVGPLGWPRQAAAAADIYRTSLAGDGRWAALLAGQGVALARREQPAGDIVRELAAEAESVLARLASDRTALEIPARTARK
ncbi:MAG: NAD(P)H-dependent flavin oxidoreductase [Gemmatimonadales bacterium]